MPQEHQTELFQRETPAHYLDHVRSRLGNKRSVAVSEVAGTCNVSVTTVYSWIEAGLVEAVNVGTTRAYYQVYAPSVIRFLEQRHLGGAQ
jgi:hypothetical protein